jgi:L-ornithine Nalpha-acyltransferase
MLKAMIRRKAHSKIYANKLYEVKVAENGHEKEQVYRLRYEVFHDELDEAPFSELGIEKDNYDDSCDHLALVSKSTGEIVGTYRILPWFKADKKGYYSEQEYRFVDMPKENVAELGRLCIRKSHRESNSFITLWLGLYKYCKSRKIRYLFGVTSLRKDTSSEGVAAIYAYLKRHNRISKKFQVQSLFPLKNLQHKNGISRREFKSMVPKILKNYMRVGTYFVGEPCYDDVFQVYDILTIFDVTTLKFKSARSIFALKNHLKIIFSKP